jgi:hypothetical protein
MSKKGMVCSVKPVLTEDLCVVQKGTIFNNICDTYICRKAKHTHKRQSHLLVREDVT